MASVRSFDTSIDIEAAPETIWTVLADFRSYPEWNPFIREIEGIQAVGEQLRVVLQPPGMKPQTFKPKIVTWRPPKHFKWHGRLFMPGLFDGIHEFEIKDLGEGQARFHQRERFKGILVSSVLSKIGKVTLEGFEQMNEALRTRVLETQSKQPST
ncbi:SRPBCC domain-containing protein [bacterium]|nr:SRPBCC domain-containing protein [bacterium]